MFHMGNLKRKKALIVNSEKELNEKVEKLRE